ncbi:hypothetical protein ACX40Y_04300 [Sphingomonas sp. RS6]
MGPAAAYLAATRRQQPAFILRDHYGKLFEDLQARLRTFGATPRFDVTYSSERTCETIRSGGDQIVIYDQYLGQTFNQLNRLHANAVSPDEARVYAYKVAAEFAQIDGQPRLAASLAIAHVANREAALTHRKDGDLVRRMRIGALQEAYVIAHEAFHTIVEHRVEWRAQMLGDARRDFLTNYYLRAIRHLEDSRHPDIDTIAPMYLRQMELFGRDDALVEECLCDTLAMAVICPHPDQQAEITQLEEVRDAIFFALRHLRLLALIRHAVREQRNDAAGDPDWLDPYLVRTQFVQWSLGQFPPLQALRTSEIHSRFEAAQTRYSIFVEDPVLYQLPAIIQELAERDLPLPPDGDAVVDALLQHPERARRVAALGEQFFVHEPGVMTQEFYDARWQELSALLDPATAGPDDE